MVDIFEGCQSFVRESRMVARVGDVPQRHLWPRALLWLRSPERGIDSPLRKVTCDIPPSGDGSYVWLRSHLWLRSPERGIDSPLRKVVRNPPPSESGFSTFVWKKAPAPCAIGILSQSRLRRAAANDASTFFCTRDRITIIHSLASPIRPKESSEFPRATTLGPAVLSPQLRIPVFAPLP